MRGRSGLTSQEVDSLGRIVVEGDASGTRQRQGDHVPVPTCLGEPAGICKPLLGEIISAGPEDEVAMVVDRPRATGVGRDRVT